jgi:hypothetical protein
MISDIQSMLNASSGKQSNTSNTVLGTTGALAKLSSEIKLIENLGLIKFQSSESLSFQGKPAQLLHATSAQQAFTLVNTGPAINISEINTAQMTKNNAFQASLAIPTEKPPRPAVVNQSPVQTQKIDNLMLGSRVVNLTVMSVSPANNETNSTPPTATRNTGASISPSTTTISSPQTRVATSSAHNQLAIVSDGQAEFPIVSQEKLKQGDVIRVLVDANNKVQVLPPKTTATIPSQQVEALKQSLPKQLSLADMSQMIKHLQNINESSVSNLPSQTQQALKQLVQNLPNLATLTSSPDMMKQAIQTSGLFSESLLLNSKNPMPADLKLNLTRLKDAQENTGMLRLGSVPTEQIANAIERITTSQLRHLADPSQINTPIYPLHIELPVKNGQTAHFIQVEIDQDANPQDQKKQDRRWLVKLKFDFEETGRFDAKASIQANKVGILFVAEDPDTVRKLQKNMPELKQQLKDKDIDVERLDAFQAKLEKEKANLVKAQSLIDVRT